MKTLRHLFPGEALLAAVVFLPARFDDPKHKQGDSPLPLPALGGNHEDPHEEMRKLFGKIEKDLRHIDRLLSDASSGPAGGGTEAAKRKTAAAVAGTDKLLASSAERGKSVLESIDRILELARHEPSESSSSCESTGGMCKGSGNSKGNSKDRSASAKEPGQDESGQGRSLLDRQGGTSTQREATPEGPEQAGKENPKPGSKDASQDPSKSGTKPAGNQSSKNPAENAAADANGDPKSGDPRGANGTADKWGDLPVHVRDVFRTQGGGDMPAQYRDWIDAYYRRMAKKAGS